MKIKGNYLVIATNIKEIHDEIGVRMISKSRYNDVSKVLLMLCAESPIKDGLVCDQEFEKQISYIRRNIYAGNRHKHHGSSGYMYGIGVAAKYKLVNGMSVDEYAHKNYSKDFEKKVHSDVGTWLSDCIGNLESKCNGIMEMLTLSNMAMLCASMDISKMNGTESVMKNLVSNCNDKTVCFPAAFLCVNCETHVLHTEKDCAFTAIHVPAQCTSHNNVKFQLLMNEGDMKMKRRYEEEKTNEGDMNLDEKEGDTKSRSLLPIYGPSKYCSRCKLAVDPNKGEGVSEDCEHFFCVHCSVDPGIWCRSCQKNIQLTSRSIKYCDEYNNLHEAEDDSQDGDMKGFITNHCSRCKGAVD